MCGIAGYIGKKNSNTIYNILIKMINAIKYRGPNDQGIWVDENMSIGFGHKRLSIIDLSSAAGQPMISDSSEYVLSFNGEIYNHLEIRKNLELEQLAPNWKGHSDTETLLAAVAAWGLMKALPKLRGMFAFSLWDRKMRSLTLVRDRIGEKPLYYGMVGPSFVFASELKAIRAIPDFVPDIDRGALALMLRYGYVPSPYSIYKGIYKLPPGTMLQVKNDGSFDEPRMWWSFRQVVQKAEKQKLVLSEEEAVDQFEKILGAAVREQMVADVPLGALFSGGIDSSLVVALMQVHSTKPVQTFSIGFQEKEYDESSHAKQIARHLGTHHTELHVTSEQALDVIPRLPEIYDEPFADSSQIPTALLCKLTRGYVSVALSGDAGDELFGGYNRHSWVPSLWRKLRIIPRWARASISSALNAVPARQYNRVENILGPLVSNSIRLNTLDDKLHKVAEVLPALTQETLYQSLTHRWRGPLPLLGVDEPSSLLSDTSRWPLTTSFSETMMAVDTLTYLPDDILVKVDRAAMSVSLETRIPFLDERLINFAWCLPIQQKIKNKKGKIISKLLLKRYLPQELFERPKQGFGVPVNKWLRSSIRNWAEDLLFCKSVYDDNVLDIAAIRAVWNKHQNGANFGESLWTILMYLSWKKMNKNI